MYVCMYVSRCCFRLFPSWTAHHAIRCCYFPSRTICTSDRVMLLMDVIAPPCPKLHTAGYDSDVNMNLLSVLCDCWQQGCQHEFILRTIWLLSVVLRGWLLLYIMYVLLCIIYGYIIILWICFVCMYVCIYIYISWGPQVGMDQPLDLETALVIVSHSHVDLDQKNQMGGEPNPQGISRLDEVFWFVFIHFNLICWGWFF